MRRLAIAALVACAGSLVPPSSLRAQSLSELLDDLFVFGGGESPLFLAGSAGTEATAVHGQHFIPSETESNGALLDFFGSAIAINVSSFPLPSTVSSQTFRFENGVPTPTSNSFGPISAERAQTIGRGRMNAGVNYSRLSFARLRGVDLDAISLTFVHQNADFPGCDEAFGGDCTDLGIPPVENDLITLDLDLAIDAEVFAFYATFGVTDWLDLGIAVPVVDLELDGASVARVDPFTGDQALHFFGGTPDNPVLEATSRVRGSATGLGDVAVRLKGQVTRNEVWNAGIMGELRVPTGREEDFLGSGSVNAKGLAILSGVFEGFSPHANFGYEHRGSQLDEDEIELVVGFDQRMAEWATLAVDLLGSFQLGDGEIEFPEPVRITSPFPRTVRLTNLPDRRDDVVDASFGFKFRTGGGLVIVANTLVALNDGGLRSRVAPTFGLEYLF